MTTTATATTTATVPDEITQDGHGLQIVNVYGRDGKYIRQLRHRGTRKTADAAARLQILHPSEDGYVDAVATMQGMTAEQRQKFAAANALLYPAP